MNMEIPRPEPLEPFSHFSRIIESEADVEKKDIPELASQIMEFLRSRGAVEYTDMNRFYRSAGSNLIVRREDPKRLLRAVADRSDLHLRFVGDEEYSNAVEWSSRDGVRGLENAWLEGFSSLGGIVTVAGYEQGEDVQIKELDDASRLFPDINPNRPLDRSLVRSVSGTIHPDEIRFIVLRVPAKFFPEDQMTDRDEELVESGKTTFIFRGYLFDHEKTEEFEMPSK